MLIFQVCDVLAVAAHNLVSTFVLGFLAPPWCTAPGGGRGGGPAQFGASGGDLGSLLLRMLSTALYFWGLRVLLVEGEAARLSLRLLMAVLGSVVLGVSLFFR